MAAPALDVLGIGNAIADVLAFVEDPGSARRSVGRPPRSRITAKQHGPEAVCLLPGHHY